MIVLQLGTMSAKMAEPTHYIETMKNSNDDSDRICDFAWLNRHGSESMRGTYFEGNLKGTLWARDVQMEHEKMLMVPNDFEGKIKNLYYNK